MPASSGDPRFSAVPFLLLIQRWPWSLHQALIFHRGGCAAAEIPGGLSGVLAVSCFSGYKDSLCSHWDWVSPAMFSLPFGFRDIKQAGSFLRPLQGILSIDLWHMAMKLLYVFLVNFGYQGLMGIQAGSPGLSFNILLPEVATWFLWIAGTFLQVWFFLQNVGVMDFSRYQKDPVSNRDNKEGVANNQKHKQVRHGERIRGKWGEKHNPRGTETGMEKEREKSNLKKRNY